MLPIQVEFAVIAEVDDSFLIKGKAECDSANLEVRSILRAELDNLDRYPPPVDHLSYSNYLHSVSVTVIHRNAPTSTLQHG